MSEGLKVLLVAAASSTTGGGERHVADLLRGLPSLGVVPSLVCPLGGDLPVLAREAGIAVEPLPIAAGLRTEAFGSLRAILRRLAPDVVHAHGSRAALYARVADPAAASRVVYTLHGVHVTEAGSALRRQALLRLERVLKPRTARFVTVCRSDAAKAEGLRIADARRTTVVYNGIPMPAAAPERGLFRAEIGVAGDVPLVLSVGRFHEQKDQATLLEAWARTSGAHPAAVLALVGSGSLADSLHEQARSLGISASVRFVEPRPDLATAYRDADVFALSSRWEGLPYVVLEAMAHGLPVVSTGVDGIPEAVVEGETGLLVLQRRPDLLASALASMLDDAGERLRFGAAGARRVAASFDLDTMLRGIRDVYAAVASGRETRR